MSEVSGGTLAARFPGAPRPGGRRGASQQPLETLLEDLDPSTADLARAALGAMLPEGESLSELGQAELQEFLWYELPVKWPVETGELHATASALADLFAAAGLDRYAALCRAPQTHRLLDAWQDGDHAPARRMMKQAILGSGVDPPDTSLMGWGSVMGLDEYVARRRVSQALEQAVDTGELVPGQRGWKQLASRITEVSLTMPRLDLHGGTLFEAVCREREESWAAGSPRARSDILAQVLPLLAGEVDAPAEAGRSLMPLRWLLERIGDGLTLTQAGWLPRALVLEADEAFGWFDLFGFRLRTETDLPELASLDELARRARLITKKGRRVSLSHAGRRALGEPDLLWRMVVADIFSAGTYEGEGAGLAAAVLLKARTSMPRAAVEARVSAGLSGRWRSVSGESPEQWPGFDATRELGLLAGVFGWIEKDGDWGSSTWRLTSPGRKAALMGLQIQSRTPRNHV